ncbi:hypothetical protein NCCP133_16680 [Cytobacillus sp. NCCP-133]|nr:hypothetical protein NCCP133_16680 [Cytobacillus sp. NCCP-133]
MKKRLDKQRKLILESAGRMVKAVNAAWDAGNVVCVAAGNSGPAKKACNHFGQSQNNGYRCEKFHDHI